VVRSLAARVCVHARGFFSVVVFFFPFGFDYAVR